MRRGEWLDNQVKSLVENVAGARDVRPHWQVVDRWVRGADVERLSRAASALNAAALAHADPRWSFESVLNYIVESVFGALLAASAGGGAYSLGRRAAYGRLEAWRSIGGLAGIAESSSAKSLQEAAAQCTWLSFFAPSGRFEDVAWELGIACLASGGAELAVLAATDTDWSVFLYFLRR